MEDREPPHSWRIALRAVLTASALLALYYLLPLDHGGALVAELAIGIVVFVAVIAFQVRAIMRSEHPEVRGLAALFVSLPLFIVLFASVYYLMSRADTSNFTSHLSRTDALYFTVTIFSTVGFGDITAKTESARLIVTAQIVWTSSSSASEPESSSGPCSAAGNVAHRRTRANCRPVVSLVKDVSPSSGRAPRVRDESSRSCRPAGRARRELGPRQVPAFASTVGCTGHDGLPVSSSWQTITNAAER